MICISTHPPIFHGFAKKNNETHKPLGVQDRQGCEPDGSRAGIVGDSGVWNSGECMWGLCVGGLRGCTLQALYEVLYGFSFISLHSLDQGYCCTTLCAFRSIILGFPRVKNSEIRPDTRQKFGSEKSNLQIYIPLTC